MKTNFTVENAIILSGSIYGSVYLFSTSLNLINDSYINKYNETDYINYLKECKYGIWVDAHESQGFALEEALSLDVPLLVWNIKSLNQEYDALLKRIKQ